MITENLSTLKINKLTQEQYDRELAAGNIDANALYLTPEEEIDLSDYATIEEMGTKADETLKSAKEYTDTAVSNLVGLAPEALNTIEELAKAIEEHEDVTDAINSAITNKANANDLTAHTNNADIHVTAEEKAKWNSLESGTQPDWNQNDETAADYIKNRPFYSEQNLLDIISDWSGSPIEIEQDLRDINELFVIYDGETYIVHSWSDDVGEFYFGDSRLHDDSTQLDKHPEDVPFLLNFYTEDEETYDDYGDFILIEHFFIHAWDSYKDTSHTFEIKIPTDEVIYHTLDEKFIPDTIARKSYVDETFALHDKTVDLPIGKCLFKYSGAKVKSTIEDSAIALSKCDLFVYDGNLKTTYDESCEDYTILSLAKRLNPNLKLFMYLSTASYHGDYTLDADGTWNESNPVVKINTRTEITEFLKRLKHAGGSVSTDESGNKIYSGGIEFDGVFYDEFDTDNVVGLTNQGGWTSIVEKQNELIDEAHSIGLHVFANSWDIISMVSGNTTTNIYNPNGLKTHLDERDFILFESNEYVPQANDNTSVMTWASYASNERLYQYTSNYYDSVKAKAVSYSYRGNNWTVEEKEIAMTWILYNTVAMGGHYVYHGSIFDYEFPDKLAIFTPNEASVPTYTKLDTGKYALSCNGHTLITHRFTINSSTLEVNLETLKQTTVTIDGNTFINAFVSAPEYSYSISNQLNDIKQGIEDIYSSSKKMSSAYVRAFIDDWIPQITPQSYTNIIPNENGSANLMSITRQDYNINGEITNSWGSYRWIIDAKPYRGKTLELGCSLYTQSWSSDGDAKLWFTIYDGTWGNASKTVIYPFTSNDTSVNNISKINLSYTVSETQEEIYVGFWAQGASVGGTFTINDIYLVDPTELEEENIIRGEDPSNTYVRINRVTSENYEKETILETDSFYIVDDGRFIATDANGNKVVETFALPKDEDGNIQHGEAGQLAVSDGNGGITWKDNTLPEFTELILKSSTEGSNKKFKITIDDDGNLKVEQILTIEDLLVDFEYTNNGDGTYSITDWNGTLNGEDSVDLVIPDDERIIL